MNSPKFNLTGDCAPWYVDVSCPPYNVTTAMTPKQQRESIQKAWDDVSAAGGGIVVLPDMYTVDRKEGTFYCLLARDNVATWGIDQLASGLRMVHDDPDGSKIPNPDRALMLVATGPVNSSGGAVNVSFARLTLDGDKASFHLRDPQHDIPQRHCLWLQEAVNVLCDQVRFLNPLMDGAYHYNDTHETTFRDCLVVGSGRNGITFTRANHNVKISRCRFRDIAAQQIDSEPEPGLVPFDILVEGCTFEPTTGTTKFVVSVAGAGRADENRTHNWRFIGNRFEGSVIVTWARNIVFSGNEWVITDETYERPCLTMNRMTEHVAVMANTFESKVDCIELRATSIDQQPRHITIDGNTFNLLQRTAQIDSQSAVNATAGPGEYVFSNNTVLGPVDGAVLAIQHRATRLNRSVIICDNVIRQCLVGFQLMSAGVDRFTRVVLEGNTFDPGQLPASFAVVLDRHKNVIDDFIMANNIWTGEGVVPVAHKKDNLSEALVPYAGSQIWRADGNAGIQATYSCLGSPLGQFDASVGSLAVRRDGGVGSTLYVKEMSTSTGWIAK